MWADLDIPESHRDRNRNMHGSFLKVCGRRLPGLFEKKPEAERCDNKSKSKKNAFWDAAMKVMQSYKIDHADKADGVIRTETITVATFNSAGTYTYVITVTVTKTGITVTATSSTDTKEHCAELAAKVRKDIMDEYTA
ncbi:MAG: hypothetical protein LBD43_03255 [Holosporales bacterium]|nr:hypothetical protein [Holosporales bacterium]